MRRGTSERVLFYFSGKFNLGQSFLFVVYVRVDYKPKIKTTHPFLTPPRETRTGLLETSRDNGVGDYEPRPE